MRNFKIAAAQVASVRGNLQQNIATHVDTIATAATHQISTLVFPELSLIGYEPDLAEELAILPTDVRLGPLQTLAQQFQMDIVVGIPLHVEATKPALGAVIFNTDGSSQTYSKMHLGPSELKFFTPGDTPLLLRNDGQQVGIAICADSSQTSHPKAYSDSGANIYAAGVFLNEEWYSTDVPRLADHASRYRMLVVMANHGASVGTYQSVGKSRIWLPGGELLVHTEDSQAALVIAERIGSNWQGNVVSL
jgi:predicted amidohydrolase